MALEYVRGESLADLLAREGALPKSCHPMDVLRTAISFIGSQDPEEYTKDSEHIRRTALELMAVRTTSIG